MSSVVEKETNSVGVNVDELPDYMRMILAVSTLMVK